MPNRPGYLRGRQHRRADLVEQRLEQVVISLIDDGDANGGAGESVSSGQAAESCADDDDMMQGCLRPRYSLYSSSMLLREPRLPGSDHPISIEQNVGHMVVRVDP